MDRRRLVVWLIVIAIAVPLVVEGYTLVGLVGSHLGGNGETPTPTAGETRTPTAEATAVGPGDDLLPETDRAETVSTASLTSGTEYWTLTLTVVVENNGTTPYEVRLGTVTTVDGTTVTGSATTGRVAPGQSGTVSVQWSIPRGKSPERVAVTAVEYTGETSRTVVDRDVRLEELPVRG